MLTPQSSESDGDFTSCDDQLQPRAQGSLCVVLASLRVAEVHQRAIAQVVEALTHFW